MFWRRKKKQAVENVFPVQIYASQLGIERRRAVRIQYPSQNLASLPSIFFDQRSLRVHDLSVGGMCLIDPTDHLGPQAGNELELRLIWPDCERVVRCRLVSRVDNRRHIQFLDLEEERRETIRQAVMPGILGQSMRAVSRPMGRAIHVEAREIWTSTKGDSVTFCHDVHVVAEVILEGKTFRIFKDSWPLDGGDKPASANDVERILIFLVNFPLPSPGILALCAQLQSIYFEGRL